MIATTRITLLRETIIVDEYGDSKDSYNAVATGIPAHIWEIEQTYFLPADGRETTIRKPKGMLNTTETVVKGDRLLDETTNTYYAVEHVFNNSSIVWAGPTRLRLAVV